MAAVLGEVRIAGTERVELAAATGRILREEIRAERDQPPFDRVMMDGIAVRFAAGQRAFRRRGTVFAGQADGGAIETTTDCLEVMTGCVLPSGADTVIPVEALTRDGENIELAADTDVTSGQFIHRQASDHRVGTPLMAPGTRLGTPDIAVLASAGAADVAVTRALRVAIVATGDELVAAGMPIAAHQIRLSNGPALVSAAAAIAGTQASMTHCPDARDTLAATLEKLLQDADAVVLSGGVSRGKADYVPDVLTELGVERRFHRVSQKPGKPLWFGRRGDCAVFGLPGNPVSTLVTFGRYVAPFLWRASALAKTPNAHATLAAEVRALASLTHFVPVTVSDQTGVCLASPVSINTSGDFTALAGTDGFVQIDASPTNAAAGSVVKFFPWQWSG